MITLATILEIEIFFLQWDLKTRYTILLNLKH